VKVFTVPLLTLKPDGSVVVAPLPIPSKFCETDEELVMLTCANPKLNKRRSTNVPKRDGLVIFVVFSIKKIVYIF
jgi:hypothetical protein